ncbi:DUF1989 domain-containing protein [Dongia sp.]|uniref:DUF1989 domain-containing protein n=1 Tax=Dongia sp. TaxID=1977262 RepID=UPI0037504A26
MPGTVIAGGGSKAFRLPKGRALKLTNTHGTQTVDMWALRDRDPSEYLSVEHTRRMLFNLFPQVGQPLFSNRRTPLLQLEADSAPGKHDMLLACCDKWLYQHYGCAPGHPNCRDNFVAALFEIGIDSLQVPNPVNLWMNVPVTGDSKLALEPPISRAGDFVVLRALEDGVVVFSACPMDISPVNGGKTPRPVMCEILPD